MIRIECQHELPYTRAEVFGHGIMADNLPRSISGLVLRTSDAVLHEKSKLHVGLEIPRVPRFAMDSRVTEFVHGERVIIEGKSTVGKATILFALTEHSSELTKVQYRLDIGVGRMSMLLAPVIKSFLEGNIDEFTDEYMGNVSSSIVRGRTNLQNAA